jgi:hypothetical protein
VGDPARPSRCSVSVYYPRNLGGSWSRRFSSLARFGHAAMSELSPFSRVMRKSYFRTSKTVIDPSRKSSTPFAVTYEAATLPSGRAKLLSSG